MNEDPGNDKRRNMTPRHWMFADEMVRGLRTYAEMLSVVDFDDPFQHLLATWTVFLLVLAWEMLGSIIVLVREGKRRAAFALLRPLIEYATRLRYYTREAEPYAAAWRASGELGPAGMDLRNTQASKDLGNTSEKLLHNMKTMPQIDLTGLDAEDRAEFQKLLYNATAYRAQKWATMLRLAEQDDTDRRDAIDAEYGLSGAYLHGDQLASFEIFMTNDAASPNFESRFAEQRIVGVALLFALVLMEAAGKASGREYGCRYFGPRLYDLFPEK